MTDAVKGAFDDEYVDERTCTMCAGDGDTECDDPIQCTDPECDGEFCSCKACGGSGLAKDQTIW